jgi:hypothetical protein
VGREEALPADPRAGDASEKEARDVKIKLDLRDVTLEAALEPLTTVAGFTWAVDRHGVLVFTPARR